MTARTEDTIAASKWEGVDAVVAQGTEAGGHGPSHDLGLPLERLLEKVSPHYQRTKRPFLLAAGGISSSSKIKEVFEKFEQVAGIVVGTGFTVAEESLWSKGQKKLVVETKGGEETDRGMEWDEVRGSMGWPEGVDGRAIRNRTRGREGTVYGGDLEGEKGEGPDLDEVGVWAGE
jgi:nitronate monooxygenase